MQLLANGALLSKSGKQVQKTLKQHFVSKARWCLSALKDAISIWAERSRQRRALAQLNSYQLKDIGLTRSDALNEASKPFWHQ